ncbi:hypothetical protein V6N12_023570 [Hibiscus sabdariffa]|uniref:Uncharacterized protein n=1 Tax=Hibiscus sabdariffa TaxID=183260 RepID=A0ABR2FYI4_9ROSI
MWPLSQKQEQVSLPPVIAVLNFTRKSNTTNNYKDPLEERGPLASFQSAYLAISYQLVACLLPT